MKARIWTKTRRPASAATPCSPRSRRRIPALIISYTLPVDPRGISRRRRICWRRQNKGVKVHSANLMVMYFGKQFINQGKSEGELGIDSANKAYDQLQKIDPAIQVGLCPCLGQNGSKDEVFTLDDAKTLKAFADKTPWVCSLHYWSINATPRVRAGGETPRRPTPRQPPAAQTARMRQQRIPASPGPLPTCSRRLRRRLDRNDAEGPGAQRLARRGWRLANHFRVKNYSAPLPGARSVAPTCSRL